MSGLPTAPYPQYRPSGTEWLEELPEHWTNSTLGFECSVKARLGWRGLKAEEYVESGYIFLATPNIKGNSIDFEDVNYITEERYEESPEIMLEVGDVLVTKDGSTTGTTNLVTHLPGPATVNSSIAVLRSFGNLDSGYLCQFFTSDYVQNVINRMRGGMGVPHLFQADLRKFFISVPPLEDQTQIAGFLDYETAKIDALIEKEQQLIGLLKEKRQAVISHAVTKGLNPDAPMRDSGVEWLGEVPAHWEVSKLKWKAETTSGGTPPTSRYEFYYESGDIPWIRTTDLNNGVMSDTPISITQRAVQDTACSVLPVNSVLLAMYGGAGSIGKHALLTFESTINQAVAGILPSRSFDSHYLHSFYEFYRPFWMIGAAGTRKDPNIGQDHIKESKLPCPPLGEQVAIGEHLDRARSQFEVLSQRADELVELLKERRTSLISAAVTGKIDVRGWKAPESETEAEVA